MAKEYDPLKCIPTADAVRRRLETVREQARRLNILLKTAEEIEQGESPQNGQGVADDR